MPEIITGHTECNISGNGGTDMNDSTGFIFANTEFPSQSFMVPFTDLSRISGDANDGIYEVTKTLPAKWIHLESFHHLQELFLSFDPPK